jgi:hypothetical protein
MCVYIIKADVRGGETAFSMPGALTGVEPRRWNTLIHPSPPPVVLRDVGPCHVTVGNGHTYFDLSPSKDFQTVLSYIIYQQSIKEYLVVKISNIIVIYVIYQQSIKEYLVETGTTIT